LRLKLTCLFVVAVEAMQEVEVDQVEVGQERKAIGYCVARILNVQMVVAQIQNPTMEKINAHQGDAAVVEVGQQRKAIGYCVARILNAQMVVARIPNQMMEKTNVHLVAVVAAVEEQKAIGSCALQALNVPIDVVQIQNPTMENTNAHLEVVQQDLKRANKDHQSWTQEARSVLLLVL